MVLQPTAAHYASVDEWGGIDAKEVDTNAAALILTETACEWRDNLHCAASRDGA